MIWQETQANKGVTLIELMIVLVIAGILVGGIYTLFTTQQRSYFVQDQVAGIQQDARAVLSIMARDIRMAGFVAGAGSTSGFTDGTTPVVVSGFNFALNPQNSSTGPDALTVVLGIEELGIVQTVAGALVTLDALDTNTPFATAVSNNLAFVAFDLQVGRLYSVSSVDFNNDQITVSNLSSGEKITEGKVYWVKAVTYSVNSGVLQRNENTGAGAQAFAGDGETTVVEDLQFAYQVEGDAGWYNDPATDFPAGSSQSDIEMVRINITVRTAVADATVQDEVPAAQFNQPALEDHTTTLAGPDGFRRRVYTTEVKVRNL